MADNTSAQNELKEEPVQDSDIRSTPSTNALGYASDWYEKGLKEAEEAKRASSLEEEVRSQMPTLAEIEEIRKSAYSDGFQEGKTQGFESGKKDGLEAGVKEGKESGYKVGYEEGLKTAQLEVQKQAQRLASFANHLVKPIQDLDSETASELVYLASRLARAFIRRDVEKSPSYIESEIAEACRLLPVASGTVSIRLNPASVALIKDAMDTSNIRIVPDPSMQLGDLHADVAMSSIEISLEERIDSFLSEFLALNRDRRNDAVENSPWTEDHSYDALATNEEKPATEESATEPNVAKEAPKTATTPEVASEPTK